MNENYFNLFSLLCFPFSNTVSNLVMFLISYVCEGLTSLIVALCYLNIEA